MKLLLFSGSHSRHFYIHDALIKLGYEVKAVIMQREAELPDPPNLCPPEEQVLFNTHFNDRNVVEREIYGDIAISDVFADVDTLYCTPDTLNGPKTEAFIQSFKPDVAFVFGVNLLHENILKILPYSNFNLHLGLSPWYRGSATLFWPFYFLQPQFAGATLHRLAIGADSGEIFKQFVPTLIPGDGIHQHAARVVLEARRHVIDLVEEMMRNPKLDGTVQKSTGRIFLTRDFQPSHLRLIYNEFNNRIIDEYLDGRLEQTKPKLIYN
ncbi:formyltransferase family protein [Amylibacter sp.]|nr:formyltransferase family protein [Amylibacter sp.]